MTIYRLDAMRPLVEAWAAEPTPERAAEIAERLADLMGVGRNDTFTVTVAGRVTREEGHAPTTCVVNAPSLEKAAERVRAWYAEVADDPSAKVVEAYPGMPRGDYWWNDLRDPLPVL